MGDAANIGDRASRLVRDLGHKSLRLIGILGHEVARSVSTNDHGRKCGTEPVVQISEQPPALLFPGRDDLFARLL
jgi:hypothetical protein